MTIQDEKNDGWEFKKKKNTTRAPFKKNHACDIGNIFWGQVFWHAVDQYDSMCVFEINSGLRSKWEEMFI